MFDLFETLFSSINFCLKVLLFVLIIEKVLCCFLVRNFTFCKINLILYKFLIPFIKQL